MSSSLETLGLSTATLRRIRDLGVDSTEGLRALAEASPVDLERHIGQPAMRTIRQALDVQGPPRAGGFDPDSVALGARDLPAPVLPPAPTSLVLRDDLFERLQRLRAGGASDDDVRVLALEDRLNALLDR